MLITPRIEYFLSLLLHSEHYDGFLGGEEGRIPMEGTACVVKLKILPYSEVKNEACYTYDSHNTYNEWLLLFLVVVLVFLGGYLEDPQSVLPPPSLWLQSARMHPDMP